MNSATEIEAAVRQLVTACETNLGVQVNLPVVYPDGQSATVVVSGAGDQLRVTDAGFGAMFLAGFGVSLAGPHVQRAAALVEKYGCKMSRGEVYADCERSQVAITAMFVGNASRAIADQALEIRRAAERDFGDARLARAGIVSEQEMADLRALEEARKELQRQRQQEERDRREFERLKRKFEA